MILKHTVTVQHYNNTCTIVYMLFTRNVYISQNLLTLVSGFAAITNIVITKCPKYLLDESTSARDALKQRNV